MVRRWDLAMVKKEMAYASLCVGSMRDQVSMQDCAPSWPPLLALIWGRGLRIQSKSVIGVCKP
jgi:hypothetical protein